MKTINSIIKKAAVLFGSASMLMSGMTVSAEENAWNFSVIWNDDDNALGIRPEEVSYAIQDDDGEDHYEETITADESWTQSANVPDTWNMDHVTTASVEHYASTVSCDQETHACTIAMNSVYAGAVSSVHIVTLWNDTNNAFNSRPSSFDLTLTGEDGTTVTQTISSSAESADIDGIPFLYNGEINRITPSTSVERYTVMMGTIFSSSQRTVYVSFELAGSRYLQNGYQKLTYDNQTMHIYKASGKEKIGMLAVPYNKASDTYTPIDFKQFAEAKNIKIKAIVNASYFNNNLRDSKYGYLYGRFQGFTTDGGTMNNTPDEANLAKDGKPYYMDLVIDNDGNVKTGDPMHSWEYNDAGGFPSQVMAGAAPAGVVLHDWYPTVTDGTPSGWYSSATGRYKMDNPNSQTALIRCDDGTYALAVVEGKAESGTGLAPTKGLLNFAKSINAGELSVYDSGGSTQMGYRQADGSMTYPVYTGRKIPSVWIIYEDLNESEPEEKMVIIRFHDNTNDVSCQKYLDEKTITVDTREGTFVSTGIEDIIKELENENYVVDTDNYPSTVDGTEPEYTINVSHKTQENNQKDEKLSYTRTIHYVDENGKKLTDDTVQTASVVRKSRGYTDLVTGTKYNTSSWIESSEESVFPEENTPEIDGYKPDQESILALDLAKEEKLQNSEVTITYSEEDTSYQITWNDGIEDTEDQTIEVKKGEAVGKELPDVTREGYEFEGWFTAPEEGEEVTDKTVPESDTNYYAHWKEKAEPSASSSSTPAASVSPTASPSASPTATQTPFAAPSVTPSPTSTPASSTTPSVTPSASASAAASAETTPSSSPTPSTTPEPTPSPSETPEPAWHLKVSADINGTSVTYIDKNIQGTVNVITVSEDGKTTVHADTLSSDADIVLSYEPSDGKVIHAWNRSGDDQNIIFTPVLEDAGKRTIVVNDPEGKKITSITSNDAVIVHAGTVSVSFDKVNPYEDTEENVAAGVTALDAGSEIVKWDVKQDGNVLNVTPVYTQKKDDVSIHIVDTDPNQKQDLNGYNSSASQENAKETIQSLKEDLENSHYQVDETPVVAEETKEVFIPVSHQIDTETSDQTGTVQRNISYVFNGNPSKNYTITQTSTITTRVSSTVDEVTKQVLSTDQQLSSAEPFAEVATPQESGWKADKESVPAADVLTSPDTPLNVTVTYEKSGFFSQLFGNVSHMDSQSVEIKPAASPAAGASAPRKTAAPLVSKEDSSDDIYPAVYACIAGIAAVIVILILVLHKRLKDENQD